MAEILRDTNRKKMGYCVVRNPAGVTMHWGPGRTLLGMSLKISDGERYEYTVQLNAQEARLIEKALVGTEEPPF